MLLALLAGVLAQAPPARASSVDPWRCPGFKDERVWGSDSRVVPLGFSRDGRFAVARRLAEPDLAGRWYYTREVKVVDLRSDRERRAASTLDVADPTRTLEEILADDGVIQTCPPPDQPALPVLLSTSVQRTPAGDQRHTELLLQTANGVKRLVRDDVGGGELRYAGSVTSPYEARAALLLVELGQQASNSPHDDVLAVLVVGSSLKDGFARDPRLELGFLEVTLDPARLAAESADLYPIGFCAKKCFAYLTATAAADPKAPRARRLRVVDLTSGEQVAELELPPAPSAFAALREAPAALELLGRHGVALRTPQLVGAGELTVELAGDAVFLVRQGAAASRQRLGAVKGARPAVAGAWRSPAEPRAAVVLSVGPPAQRDFVVLGAPLAGPAPLPSERLAAIGFSEDGSRFAAVVTPPQATSGAAVTWDVATARPTAGPGAVALGPDGKPTALPPALGALAADPGREGYTSGSRRATTVQLPPRPVGVDLVVVPAAEGQEGERAQVVLSRGACRQTLPLPTGATDFNLSSVLTSSEGASLAVVVKATQGGVRRFQVVTASLANGPLSDEECRQPARSTGDLEPACLAQLKGLRGGYGISGHPDDSASISGEGELSVAFRSSVDGVGGASYQVAGCTLARGALVLSLDSGGERIQVTLTPQRSGALRVSGSAYLCESCTLRPR